MPRRQQLPEALARLSRRNALSVRHESFRADADRLLAAVEPILRPRPASAPGCRVSYAGRRPSENRQSATSRLSECSVTAAISKMWESAHNYPLVSIGGVFQMR